MRRGSVTAIVGAQFGSEGKGVVAHHLASKFQVAVRTGGPNAGHSIVHEGTLFKMQSVPCGWVNRDCILILGAGAVISPQILLREIDDIRVFDKFVHERIVIDGAATILEPHHHEEEGGTAGELHQRMGSTGEGVGAARRGRMLRDPTSFRLARDCKDLRMLNITENTAELITNQIRAGRNVVLEGTQGCGLSLTHGYWPHVTTTDTNAAQLAADAGIPPQWVNEVILVARTFPIRVAGHSGALKDEISWDELSVKAGKTVIEHTTVTRKVRRVGGWDEQLFRKAVTLNDPAMVALTFVDYFKGNDGVTRYSELTREAMEFIHYLEQTFDVHVGLIGTGWDPKKGWSCIQR